MKAPVLIAVDRPAEEFAPLFTAAKAAGLRIGWLAMNASVDPPPPLRAPPLLAAFRAVAVGDGVTNSVPVSSSAWVTFATITGFRWPSSMAPWPPK